MMSHIPFAVKFRFLDYVGFSRPVISVNTGGMMMKLRAFLMVMLKWKKFSS